MSTGTYMNQHTILERRNRLVTSRNQTHEGVMLNTSLYYNTGA